MKKLVVVLGVLVVVAGGIWYTTTLNKAEEKREAATSREVDPTTQTLEKIEVPVSDMKQQSPEFTTSQELATGSFVELDPLHKGSGDVKIIQENEQVLVQFQENFEVADGPDLYVRLVKKQDLGGAVNGVNSTKGEYLELGPLTKQSGAQTFAITQQEFQEYNYAVVIWCEAFGVQFTNAVL